LYTSLNTVLVMGGTVVGAYFLGVKGIFAFTYIALLGCIGAGMVYLKRGGWIWCDARVVITKEEASEFNRFSLVSMFNNGVSFLVYIIDVFLIGVITEDMNVLASYKTATLIPFALTFIPSTIMTFVYPYFANHQNDKNWVRNHYMKLLKYCLGLNLCISLFLIFFSKLIVQICFGKEYLDCVSIFIVLAIGYFFTASLRIPGGNVLASLGKIKVNFYITVAMGLFNIIADVVLIYWMGSIGAAISTLSVFLLSGLVSNLYLYRYLLSK
ncbi:oligosaccharide flippase family protein, partial [Bacteroides uniformis]